MGRFWPRTSPPHSSERSFPAFTRSCAAWLGTVTHEFRERSILLRRCLEMKAQLLRQPHPVEQAPLELTDLPMPTPGDDEVLLRVHACGVCHTDLHTVEGEISGRLPVVPGHQIVGVVEQVGKKVGEFHIGDRVGVPWLHRTCGECEFCRSDHENLCERAQFTGFHVNGGYAEYAVAP